MARWAQCRSVRSGTTTWSRCNRSLPSRRHRRARGTHPCHELEQHALHRPGAGLRDPDTYLGGAVKLTMSTSGDSMRRAAASAPLLTTRLTTPGGNPTRPDPHELHHRERILGAGFTTTVLPIASAGATLPAMFTSGSCKTLCRRRLPPLAHGQSVHEAARCKWRGVGDLRLQRPLGNVALVLRIASKARRRDSHLHRRPDRQGRAGLRYHQGTRSAARSLIASEALA